MKLLKVYSEFPQKYTVWTTVVLCGAVALIALVALQSTTIKYFNRGRTAAHGASSTKRWAVEVSSHRTTERRKQHEASHDISEVESEQNTPTSSDAKSSDVID